MNYSISAFRYFSIGLLIIFILSFWAGLRGFDGVDTEVYLLFYQKLIDNGIVGIQSCQSFEPVYCGLSFTAGYISNNIFFVHYFWVFIYFSTTFRAFSILYNLVSPKYKFRFVAVLFFTFIAINFIDPQIVFFLTRQYVASAFLMLGFAKIATDKNPSISFIIATLIHFGAFPIALIAYVLSRKFELKWWYTITLPGAVLLLIYFWDSYIFEVYFESLKYKSVEYSDKNDGDVTPIQEVKLILYWGLSAWFFLRKRIKIVLALFFIYIFYLLTSFNDLLHLRYYKYLESMSWPAVFMLSYFFKRQAPYFIVAVLSFRIYKYLILVSPESGVFNVSMFWARHVFSFLLSWLESNIIKF
ncbi:EpsG family [Burkholderiaceae bacterium]